MSNRRPPKQSRQAEKDKTSGGNPGNSAKTPFERNKSPWQANLLGKEKKEDQNRKKAKQVQDQKTIKNHYCSPWVVAVLGLCRSLLKEMYLFPACLFRSLFFRVLLRGLLLGAPGLTTRSKDATNVTSATLVVTSALLVVTRFATRGSWHRYERSDRTLRT